MHVGFWNETGLYKECMKSHTHKGLVDIEHFLGFADSAILNFLCTNHNTSM